MRAASSSPSLWRQLTAGSFLYYLSCLTGVAALLVLADGTYGEITALLALERQRASASNQSTVMHAVVTLTVATGIALIVRFVGTAAKEHKSSSSSPAGDDPS